MAWWSEPCVPLPRYSRSPAGSAGSARFLWATRVHSGAAVARQDTEEAAGADGTAMVQTERLLGEERDSGESCGSGGGSGRQESHHGAAQPGESAGGSLLSRCCTSTGTKATQNSKRLKSELHKRRVREPWNNQLMQQNKEEVTELKEQKRYENEFETARGEALKRIRQEGEKQQAEMLLKQIEELKFQKTKGKREFIKVGVGAGDRVALLFSTMCLFAGETYILYL
ncbi:trichoplein keratin filament-binding protein-like [Chamaea fasciata]|uniref:trichoplein keratin filament-binding protein-like n=1 Tax=Chamaea fasciata TaxID=190680 RepID=UPI00336A4BE6